MPGKGEIMERWKKKIKNKQYGQAMVEFALTLPIFLLAVLGVIEMSRFFLVYSSVYTASREASRFASSTDLSTSSIPHYKDCNGIRQVAIETGFFSGIVADQITINIEDVPGNVVASCREGDSIPHTSSGDPYEFDFANRVLVEITATFQPITPVIPSIPVVASNGRTILRDIRVRDVPQPFPSPTPLGWLGCNSFVFLEGSGVSGSNKYDILIRNISPDIDFKLIGLTNTNWKMNNTNLIAVDWVLHATDGEGNPIQTSVDVWDGTFQKENYTLNFQNPFAQLPSNTYGVITLTFDKNLNSQDWVDAASVLTDDISGIVCEHLWLHP